MVIGTSTLLLYAGTWVLVAFSPGPAVLYVIAQASRGGMRRSFPAIAGLQLGSLLFFLAAGMGFAALLATMETAFVALKILGALYLGWLGAGWLWGSFRPRARPAESGAPAAPQHGRVFWQGLLIQLTNPKALLFATALLPQFLDARQPMLAQIPLLFAIGFTIDTSAMLAYAALAAHGARQFRGSRAAAWLERLLGAALIGFGVRLALAQR